MGANVLGVVGDAYKCNYEFVPISYVVDYLFHYIANRCKMRTVECTRLKVTSSYFQLLSFQKYTVSGKVIQTDENNIIRNNIIRTAPRHHFIYFDSGIHSILRMKNIPFIRLQFITILTVSSLIKFII